jgi:uncharacterized protein (TIGR00369 family)
MQEQAKAMFERAVSDGRQVFGSFFLSRFFGMEVEYGEDTCTVAFESNAPMLNPQGSLHGGVLATALDISMGHLLKKHFGAGATLEMKVQYLESVRSGRVACQATFIKKGRKLFFLQSTAKDATGESIAFATSTWKLHNTA